MSLSPSVRGSGDDAERAEAILPIIRDGWGRSGGAFVTAFTTLYMPDAGQEELRRWSSCSSPRRRPRTPWPCAGRSMPSTSRTSSPGDGAHARLRRRRPPGLAGAPLSARIPGAELSVLDSGNHVPLPRDPAWQTLVQATEGFLSARD